MCFNTHQTDLSFWNNFHHKGLRYKMCLLSQFKIHTYCFTDVTITFSITTEKKMQFLIFSECIFIEEEQALPGIDEQKKA